MSDIVCPFCSFEQTSDEIRTELGEESDRIALEARIAELEAVLWCIKDRRTAAECYQEIQRMLANRRAGSRST